MLNPAVKNTTKKWWILAIIICSVLMSSSAVLGSNTLDVNFSWDGIRKCAGISPEIHVGNIPEGTVSFKVTLKDLDAPDYNHGGGMVPNDGSGIIPKRALRADSGLKNRYKGPCPPMGAHNYEFTVIALDKDGNTLAEGKAVQPFA